MGIWSALAGTDNPANKEQPRQGATPRMAARQARRGGNAVVATTRRTGNIHGSAKSR